jgi:YegS/Rv2252/BmrU family lipid kinase
MKKILVIYNPVAGHKIRKNVETTIKEELEKNNCKYEWFETQPVEHQYFDDFLKQDANLIIVAGGDGTVNEVASFIVNNNIETPMAIVAQGTGNILAQSLKIPCISIRKAVKFAITNSTKYIDVMKINNKWIGLVAAGQGYDVVFMNGATRDLKQKFGFLAYVSSFLKTYLTYHQKEFKIELDGKSHVVKAKVVAAFNILSIGGMHLHGSVKPNDGIVNLAIINPRTIWGMIIIILKSLFNKVGENDKKLRVLSGSKITIKQIDGEYVQIDGEVKPSNQLDIEVISNKLSIIH